MLFVCHLVSFLLTAAGSNAASWREVEGGGNEGEGGRGRMRMRKWLGGGGVRGGGGGGGGGGGCEFSCFEKVC